MMENIKNLYSQIDYKTGFIIELSEDLGKSTHTVANHWLGRFWNIPEQYQPRVVELLQKRIALQNDSKTEKV